MAVLYILILLCAAPVGYWLRRRCRRYLKGALFFVICCACVFQAHAQETARTPVIIDCSCPNTLGSRYATALRDLFARSPRFVEVKTAPTQDLTWTLHITTLDTSGGNEISIAVVICAGSLYFTDLVQSCGSDVINKCAASTLALFDAAAR